MAQFQPSANVKTTTISNNAVIDKQTQKDAQDSMNKLNKMMTIIDQFNQIKATLPANTMDRNNYNKLKTGIDNLESIINDMKDFINKNYSK